MSISMPVLNSGGNVVDDLNRMGWSSGSDIVRRAYFRQACRTRMEGGGSDASSSIRIIGEV